MNGNTFVQIIAILIDMHRIIVLVCLNSSNDYLCRQIDFSWNATKKYVTCISVLNVGRDLDLVAF